MRIDFHLHSLFSDGELLPSEIVARCKDLGYEAIAITDHIDHTNIEDIQKIKEIKNKFKDIEVLVGAEITHVAPKEINSLVKEVKEQGAEIIILHGESIVEPVPKGTNKKAVRNEEVDILAHPGLIKEENVKKAAQNNVFLELTSRRGHCYTNGHLANLADKNDARLLVNTDSHSPSDLISRERAIKIAMGAGLSEGKAKEVVDKNPKKLLRQIR
ncbi:PHP domain-containing protein [archaeon SCG-AAA382B04]|nr:PHP domain-containing protein [archaeon SCG-AAA382B04]